MKKDHKKAWKIINQIAKQERVTIEYVMESIEYAAKEAYLRAWLLGDLEKMKMWEKIPKEGENPNALEIIEYMGNKFKMR